VLLQRAVRRWRHVLEQKRYLQLKYYHAWRRAVQKRQEKIRCLLRKWRSMAAMAGNRKRQTIEVWKQYLDRRQSIRTAALKGWIVRWRRKRHRRVKKARKWRHKELVSGGYRPGLRKQLLIRWVRRRRRLTHRMFVGWYYKAVARPARLRLGRVVAFAQMEHLLINYALCILQRVFSKVMCLVPRQKVRAATHRFLSDLHLISQPPDSTKDFGRWGRVMADRVHAVQTSCFRKLAAKYLLKTKRLSVYASVLEWIPLCVASAERFAKATRAVHALCHRSSTPACFEARLVRSQQRVHQQMFSVDRDLVALWHHENKIPLCVLNMPSDKALSYVDAWFESAAMAKHKTMIGLLNHFATPGKE
jgi:hypothetical protein